MKIIRQLLRQPLKTVTGILLVTLAVAALCVCVGQGIAAEETQKNLNESYLSVALPSVNYTAEADEWAKSYALEHPEVVKGISAPGLISGYTADMVPLNYINYTKPTTILTDNYRWESDYYGYPYNAAMFEITLQEIGERRNNDNSVSVSITGSVDRVVGIAEGYPDYQGFQISSTLNLPSGEALDALDLTVGERYLIYGTDLSDSDWWLRWALAESYHWNYYIDSFDLEKLTMLEEKNYTVDTVLEISSEYLNAAKYETDGYTYYLTGWQLEYVHLIQQILEDQSATAGEAVHELYREPTIVRLDGTAEEFLASEEGWLWAEALRNIQINSQSFPVIGIQDLTDAADFAQGKADIGQGRAFLEEELESGAKVCLISESLAQHNGLSVGDTISFSFYENDPDVPSQVNISEGNGCLNPGACYFFENTMALEPEETYTVVGFYRQDTEWEDINYNLHTFTPNTVFVPEGSVEVQMEYSYGAFFRTIHLHNGTIEEFQTAAAEAGYADMFYYNDNGFAKIEPAFRIFEENAGKALAVGLGVYAVVMLLFLFLYPCQQGTVLSTMESLGTVRSRQIFHVINSTMTIFAAGTVLGTGAGLLLWDRVKRMLMQGEGSVPEIGMNIPTMLGVSGVQALVCLLAVALIALAMTHRRNLMKKK